jgi:hypothetical protein
MLSGMLEYLEKMDARLRPAGSDETNETNETNETDGGALGHGGVCAAERVDDEVLAGAMTSKE